MWTGTISYTVKIGNADRVEKDCYESESLFEVTEHIYRAIEANKQADILEVHIYRK